MSLLVVGSVAFDALESPYGKVDRTLGGAATYFSVAASFFSHVSLVGIVGDDFTAKDAEIFRGRHIDVDGLERAPRGFRSVTARPNSCFWPTLRRICSATCCSRCASGPRSRRSTP